MALVGKPVRPSLELRARSMRDWSRASELIVGAVGEFLALSGNAGFSVASHLQQAWPDVNFAARHVTLNPASVDDSFEEIGALVAPMLGRRLFVGLSRAHRAARRRAAHRAKHLRHLMGGERDGAIFGSGPLLEGGQPGQRSLFIIRADSEDAARTILAEEPFHKRGLETVTLHEWSLNEGRVMLSVDVSTQRGGVDGVVEASASS